jgi:phosphatidylserine decarboxylase
LIHLAVFLSPFDVHIQYTPCQGEIIDQTYKKGEFHMAHLFEKSKYNERMETTIRNKVFGQVKILQIAGLLARSIVNFYNKGDKIEQNVPFGLIRLGSRVDIILKDSKKYQIAIKQGDKIKIGDPIITTNSPPPQP